VNGPRADESGQESPVAARRYFVAIATANYSDPRFPSLPVSVELAQLMAWLCDSERLGDRAFTVPDSLADLAHDPGEDRIRAALRSRVKPWSKDDIAVVFITGHGAMADGDHWTVLADSDADELPTTALRTADLVRWLAATKIQNLLLIIDTCFAGAIVKQTFNWDVPVPESWLILPSARAEQRAIVGGLTTAIGRAVEKLRGEEGRKYGTDEHFTPTDFLDTVKSFLGPRQTVDQEYRGPLGKPHPCLPNPHYTPPAAVPTQPARHELALPKQDLKTHWGPRARGVEGPESPGWLFTGRAELMRELIRIVGTDQPETTLITGGAGCGKSAVLARVVTLSDPQFLATYGDEVADIPDDLRPREGAVDVAVVASQKWPHQILGQLAEALTVPHPATIGWAAESLDDGISAWTDWLAARETPVTIVLDALDEATNPRAVVDLLARLTTRENANKVRLLVGVRSTGGDPYANAEEGYNRPLADDAVIRLNARRLRVDDDPWWHQDDIREYSASILSNTAYSPYAATRHQEAADQISREIARRTGRSFLIARMAATSLAGRSEVLDPADEKWLAAIDAGVVGVFRDDLWQTFPNDQSRREDAVTLLRAVAYAYGRGLPWGNIWPAVANAIADRTMYGDRDVVLLLDSRMNAYLVSDREDGVTVYRLFHDMLRTTLRDNWEQLLVDPGTLLASGG
jgi:hypothetical protein